jgi:flagellar biosynthesis/type III secretory pathway protein FliH
MLNDAKKEIASLVIDTAKKVLEGEVPQSLNQKAVKVLENS